MFFVVARDSEKDTFGVDGGTDYDGDGDPRAQYGIRFAAC
jgi:hypothetical protein